MKVSTHVLIGRDPSCPVRFEDDTVSRHHARVRANGDGRLYLEDLDSSNGTWHFVGAEWRAVRGEALDPNSRVRFGEVEVILAEALDAWPTLWLTAEEGDDFSGPLRLVPEEADDPGLEKPRRNPKTGDIEESS